MRCEWTRDVFIGSFPADLIPTSSQTRKHPYCMVLNTDTSNEAGTHWVAVYVRSPCAVDYFDSFADWPPMSADIHTFLQRFSNINRSATCLQSDRSGACGKHFGAGGAPAGSTVLMRGGSTVGYPVFTGLQYQRGGGVGGLGSMFRSFLRFLLPIGRQAGSAIGRQGMETGARVLSSVLEGKNLRESLVDEGRAGLRNLLDKAADSVAKSKQQQSGSGGGNFDFKRYRKRLDAAEAAFSPPLVLQQLPTEQQHQQQQSSIGSESANQQQQQVAKHAEINEGFASTPSVPIELLRRRLHACIPCLSEQSALAFNSALNVFAVPPTNVSVSRSFFRELLPLSTISQEGPYLFRMFNDSLWADLSRVYLYLELSIKKPNTHGIDVPIDANDDADVGPCQSIGQTFVQQLKVEVQNTELYDSGTLYPFKAYITNELSFPDSVKRNFMASSGYYPSLTHDDRSDAGFRKRCARFAGGRKAQFFSRLDFDLGNQELYLLSNMDVLFTIYRARDSFLLQCLAQNAAAGRQYSLFVHDIKLYVKMVEVQPSLNMSIYKTLEKQPATYAVRRTEVKSCFLTAGRTELDHNIFSAAIPRRLTIALVINRAFNGAYALCPFDFRPYNIRDISVHAGGHVYPAVPHRMNFKEADYVRPFVDMYEALGMANSERSMDITLEQFRDGWTFFVVPMTSTLDDSCGFELLRSGTTSVRLQFNEAIPLGGVEMICLGEFDQLIMIDYNRHIVTDSKIA
uniref:ULP_PROTEASE domain-containing protein n=1 Tax=Globodera pallida TaxID=36090 RepID=A0A183BNZ4_GLOPA